MLMRLGRWLRAAGHDALMFPPGTADARLMAEARSQQRLLLTRDRKLTEFSGAAAHVLLLRGNDTDACARELRCRIGLDWLYRPFSRCLLCNRMLEPGSKADLLHVPQDSRHFSNQCWRCPACDKLYWQGSHTRRMLERLKTWQAS